MRMKLKKWSIPFLVEHPEVYISKERYQDEEFRTFISSPLLKLEIGPGKGDFIIQMAKKYPHYHFLVIELNVSVAAMTAQKIVKEQLMNVRLIQDDALVVLPLLNPKSIETIYLNFSDPWPKKRHEKRRLTSPRFLEVYKLALKDDGKIVQKTDQQSLYLFSLESYEANGWRVCEKNEDYQLDSNVDAMTEYEAAFRAQGHPIYRIIAVKE